MTSESHHLLAEAKKQMKVTAGERAVIKSSGKPGASICPLKAPLTGGGQ